VTTILPLGDAIENSFFISDFTIKDVLKYSFVQRFYRNYVTGIINVGNCQEGDIANNAASGVIVPCQSGC